MLLEDVVLREATAADAGLVYALTREAYAEYVDTLRPPSGVFGEDLEFVRGALARHGGVIAFVDRMPAGCGRCEKHVEPAFLYVGRLAVLPAFRGRGIASRMMVWFEERAKALGLPEVQLGVRVALPLNIKLYTRLGYEVFAYEERPGYGRVSAEMRKRL